MHETQKKTVESSNLDHVFLLFRPFIRFIVFLTSTRAQSSTAQVAGGKAQDLLPISIADLMLVRIFPTSETRREVFWMLLTC